MPAEPATATPDDATHGGAQPNAVNASPNAQMQVGDSSVASSELTQASLGSFSEPRFHDSLDGPPPPAEGFVTDESVPPSLPSEAPPPSPSEPSASPNRTKLASWLAPSLIGVGTLVSISLIWTWWQQNQQLAALPSKPLSAADSNRDAVDDAAFAAAVDSPSQSRPNAARIEEAIQEDARPDSADTGSKAEATPTAEPGIRIEETPPADDAMATNPMAQVIPNDFLPGNPLLDEEGPATDDEADPLAGMPRRDTNAEEPDASGVGMLELPAGLSKFTQLLDLPGEGNVGVPTAEPPAMEELLDEAAETIVDPLLMATPPVEVDFQRALNIRVALKSDGYPLPELLNEISQIIQVPIDLKWVQLELAGIPVDENAIDPEPGWKTSGELLQKLALTQGAILTQEPTHITFGVAEERLVSRLREYTDPSDLPEDWQEPAASAAARIASVTNDPLESQIAAALTTDALRRCLEQSPKLSDDVFARLAIRQDAAKLRQSGRQDLADLWPRLVEGKSGTQTYTPMTLPAFISRTARVNRASCLIHWPDLIERRIPVGQRVMGDASLPAGELLSDILSPLALQTRLITPQLWWVGTEATYDRTPTLVFGSAGANVTRQGLNALTEQGLGPETGVSWWLDDQERFFVIVLPRYLYRQLPTLLGQTPAT
ncbi:MAG: hypothetical protein AAGD07_07810 [Planctomycetota bacterium]